MTASRRDHGMMSSLRARNFSRRVIFFLAANSACEKLGWWVMPLSLGSHTVTVSNKLETGGIKSAFP
jgi:hypothetical protein